MEDVSQEIYVVCQYVCDVAWQLCLLYHACMPNSLFVCSNIAYEASLKVSHACMALNMGNSGILCQDPKLLAKTFCMFSSQNSKTVQREWYEGIEICISDKKNLEVL